MQTKDQFLNTHSCSTIIAGGPKLQGFEMIQLDPLTCQISSKQHCFYHLIRDERNMNSVGFFNETWTA